MTDFEPLGAFSRGGGAGAAENAPPKLLENMTVRAERTDVQVQLCAVRKVIPHGTNVPVSRRRSFASVRRGR